MELSDYLSARGEIEVLHLRQGQVLASLTTANLVTDHAVNLLLETMFRNAPRNGWYFGLRGNGAHTAQDTPSSKAWAEFTGYAGERPAFVPEVATGGVIRNQNHVTFDISGGEGIVRGAFLTNAQAKGAGDTYYMVCSFGRALIVYGGDQIALRYKTSLKQVA